METASPSRPTGIVAFVLTDLEGSTRQWEHTPGLMAVNLARHLSIVDEVCERWSGQRAPEQGAGDSTVSAFCRASDALAAAVDLQQVMRSEVWEGSEPLLARVAVHVGEVHRDDTGRYQGPTMNRAGRLLQAGHGGQILASSTAVELGRAGLRDGVELIDLGPHRLRGIDEPVGIVQVTPGSHRKTFPPLRTVGTAAATLPHPDSSLVGRAHDLRALAELLDQHRVLSVVGAGGCGKTRLAIELAHETIGRFAHGAAWVDLAALSGPDAVVDAVAAGVGLHTTAELTTDRIVGHLAPRALLLLVDNCEHVIDNAAATIAAIQAGCPAVRIVATSREPLALRDEVVWRVPSLGTPLATDGADLLDSDAGRLLVERIRRVRPDYEPDGDDCGALAEVCRRLDGIPLALELAAARTATIPPQELAERLTERFALLAGGSRDSVARQRTIEASVAWSYQLLDPGEQRVFRWLSAFAGTFPMSAAAALLGDEPDVEDVIDRLQRCSLLVDRPGPVRRIHLLEPVRWFARERLIDAGEADDALGRHLDWCIATAINNGAALEEPEVLAALTQLDLDLDNFRAAMDWALTHGRPDAVARIVAATPWFWIWRGRALEALRWLHRSGDDVGQPLTTEEQLRLLWARASLGINTTSPGWRGAASDGIALARTQGDTRWEARFQVLVSQAQAFNDPHTVLAQAEAQRERCIAAGERFWAATSLVSESLAQITLGRFDLAQPLLDQLRVEAEALEHPQLLADEIARRALVDRRFGRYNDVHAASRRIGQVTAPLTELNAQALVHAQAALVDVAQGHAAEVLDAMEALMRRHVDAGEYGYVPSIALPIIDALIDLDRGKEAVDRFEPFWESFRQSISWRLRMGNTRALALYASGDSDTAWSALEDVLSEAHEAPNEHEVANAERLLAAIDRDAQRFAHAEDRLHRALDTQARLGYPQYVADVLEELAGIDLDHARPTPAAVLFGAASAIRDASGVVRRIGRQHAYDTDVDRLRDTLDEADLAEAWAKGRALSMADAVDLASRGRGERRRPAMGWESLTATEAKVAALVAEGHTNPEIAEALIMGRATVKTHVSNILRKLGLTNRTQVATALARR
jgi:predicted ATPase/class 3 adenylate cyclase/DNA-binding CsgD family transcriptional regulator